MPLPISTPPPKAVQTLPPPSRVPPLSRLPSPAAALLESCDLEAEGKAEEALDCLTALHDAHDPAPLDPQ